MSETPVRFWVLLKLFLKLEDKLLCGAEVDDSSFTQTAATCYLRGHVQRSVMISLNRDRDVDMYGRFLQFPPLLNAR
jgi:hypothetical protein